ncbi:GGDEF domain-containing protein [Mycolicibacterium mengxianglii]|uniref:GGDEF domain-containing protein n=1 Tax=Mycolicibacterium mengxianglii TaxID=2736649 RepID=UPI0018EED72D|nr:GGDEF domain-containing protein [Mycolicibacterium mengxianglii]
MAERLQRWWRNPDHYYWMTAYLAAQGAQTLVCRSVALATAGLGLIPLSLLASPSGPHGTVNRTIALVVTGCCFALALIWLRPVWPSRRMSGAFVLISSVCIAVTCLIGGDPVANVSAGAAFAILAAFISVFHTARYVAFNLFVAVITVTVTAIQLAQARDVVFALCAGLFIVLLNMVVPTACQILVHVLEVDVLSSDIDAVTGLLNKDAFYQHTSELIGARNRGDDRYLVIVVATLDQFRLLGETSGRVTADRARVAVAQTLRDVTRRDAVVAHIGEEEFLVSDTFQTTDVTPLVDRMRSAIAATPPRLTASVGVVSTPLKGLANAPSNEVLDEMVTIATVAMFDARLAGGDQVRYVECPPLRALDDRRDD